MKKLINVRIINWHYFYNVKFSLDQVNFLTGQNAAGKSTLIDAMQVVLLGDTSGRQFNKAANEKAGRTLKGYLKGEIGDDGEGSFRYLRNGRFSSYIVLEWYDDLNDAYFCTGIVFDVYEDNSEDHHFFILNDKMPNNDFCLLQVPMSYRQLNEYFSINYRNNEYYFAESNAQYQVKIKEIFGGLKDKYFSLFKKAVSFTPITNIEQFLTEYVCDVPSEINVDSMRNNIQQYKRLEIEAENMQVKINKLEEIQRFYNAYVEKRKEQDLASYISKRLTYQVSLNSLSNLQQDVASSNARLSEIEEELDEIEDKLSSYNKQKEDLIAQKVSSGAYQLTSELTTLKENSEKRINEIEDNLKKVRMNFSSYINNFSSYAHKIVSLCEMLKEHKIYLTIKKDVDHLLELSTSLDQEITSFKEVFTTLDLIEANTLDNFRKALSNYKNSLMNISLNIRSLLNSFITEFNANKERVEQNKSSKYYDVSLIQIRNELKHRLSDYFHEDVDVLIYADLVDIKNPIWVNAIEGYIANQKLGLFVKDEYYEVACKMLSTLAKQYAYYRTNIVDSERLHQANIKVEKNSLAEEIITSHQGAQDYSSFLLGKIIKCKNFKEARDSGHGITPECDGYRNFASFTLNVNSYRYPLIGRKVSDEFIKVRELEVKQNQETINLLQTLLNTLNEVNALETLNINEVEQANKVLQDAMGLSSLKENLNRYEMELASSSSLEITTIENRIKKVEDNIASCDEDKANLIQERGEIKKSIKIIEEEKIPSLVAQSNAILEEINSSFDKEFIDNVALVKFDEEMNSGKSLNAIRQQYDELYLQAQAKIRLSFSSLGELRRNYCASYKLSYDTSKTTNEEFDNELNLLRDIKLPQYQEKIKDAYAKATKEFKDDFIFKLKTSIETVRSQIDDLNDALKDARFGNDSYKFIVQPAPQYKEYYDMITDNLLLEYGDDENAYFEKYHDVMNSLFKMIGDVSSSSDQNSLLEQNVVKFTDYRTYLNFDMLVTKGEGKSYSLAKNIKKQSGGETQTPFYVSILASFSQLYRIRQEDSFGNCIRLVIFDEAFSKMDSTRIIESIKILKNFGLQVILSAPSEKISDLAKLVDKTLVVTRQNSRSFVDNFEIKKDK